MYNDIIIENFSDPQHVGDLESADIELEVGNSVCGDRIRVQILLDDNKISNALFRAWGCATSVATANIFCDSLLNQSLDSVCQRDVEYKQQMLGELSPSQHHCMDILNELHQLLSEQRVAEDVANG